MVVFRCKNFACGAIFLIISKIFAYGTINIHSFFDKNNFIRTKALKSERRTMGRTMAFCLEQRKINNQALAPIYLVLIKKECTLNIVYFAPKEKMFHIVNKIAPQAKNFGWGDLFPPRKLIPSPPLPRNHIPRNKIPQPLAGGFTPSCIL